MLMMSGAARARTNDKSEPPTRLHPRMIFRSSLRELLSLSLKNIPVRIMTAYDIPEQRALGKYCTASWMDKAAKPAILP